MNFISRIINPSSEASENIKRLGYSAKSKLLIVHADDMGLSHSTNMACIEVLEFGNITSASIMVPCLCSGEAINYSKTHKDKDIGIHLTLTSEWPGHKWKPILGKKVSSLTDSTGFFFETREELEKMARISEVEQEWRSQIELALIKGMHPTHLDCHMFSGLINQEFLKLYIRLGRSYGMPVLLNSKKISKWFHYNLKPYVSEQEILVDRLIIATPGNIRNGHFDYYRNVLQSLRPGLNCLLVHPSFDDHEMKSMTEGRTDYNSRWRQTDFDFFTSEECNKIIRENNINLISWREINQKFKKVPILLTV